MQKKYLTKFNRIKKFDKRDREITSTLQALYDKPKANIRPHLRVKVFYVRLKPRQRHYVSLFVLL